MSGYKIPNILGVSWGIFGVTLVLVSAISRVLPHALDALRGPLTPIQVIILVGWCIVMLVAEGHRGFRKKFSPRVVDRAWSLMKSDNMVDLVFSPLYCMSYFHDSRRRIVTSGSVTVGVILLIFIVTKVPQPWRGIIDSGVVLGLIYGLIWVYIFAWRKVAELVK